MLDGIGVVLTKLLEKGQFFEELAADCLILCDELR